MFAMTAMYHWLFVPLTLGLSFMIAWFETMYVRTGDVEWRRTTKFWMKLFGINFAIGVATGLILEFEFGTNWSNYSYFVGDIFGAPLAIEGIFAFFIESTFVAIMFFGWNKVGKKTHLVATWLTAIGASLSAWWILVANAWMQSPVGMEFNPATARNEMVDFWAVAFSPVAVNKFFHTVTSGFVLAAVFVVGICGWYIVKGREATLTRRSIRLAAIFGIVGTILVIWTGHGSAQQVARVQPMKLAAMEALYDGRSNAPLEVLPGIEIPSGLSWFAYGSPDARVEGINDLVAGAVDKMERGRVAIELLATYKEAQAAGDTATVAQIGMLFKDQEFKDLYFSVFGYGYLNAPEEIVPPVGLTYWSFRVMVGLGFWFLLVFVVGLWFTRSGRQATPRLWGWIYLWSVPLVYIASQAGWVVAEVGRQPWTVQELLPTMAAVSRVPSTSIQVTFWLFVALFTAMLAAEITIMVKQIKKGPSEE